jgi:spore coat protein U-like protein
MYFAVNQFVRATVFMATCLLASVAFGFPGVTCQVGLSSIVFGGYDPLSPRDLENSSGHVEVSCFATAPPIAPATSYSVPYTITLSAGLSNNFAARTMRLGADSLTYNLYTNSNFNQVWSEVVPSGSVGGTVLNVVQNASASVGPRHAIWARIPARQYKPPGVYQDVVNINVAY